jgi:hypothetical protein
MSKKLPFTTPQAAVIIGALVVSGMMRSPKKPNSSSIILTPNSIKIQNEQLANKLIVTTAETYARKELKELDDLSYITLVGNLIKSLSAKTFEVYNSQKLSHDGILIIAYLSISLRNAFKIVYFGEIAKLTDIPDDIKKTPEYSTYMQFVEQIDPARLAEFHKFIGYDESMQNDLNNVIEIIKKNDKYPAE